MAKNSKKESGKYNRGEKIEIEKNAEMIESADKNVKAALMNVLHLFREVEESMNVVRREKEAKKMRCQGSADKPAAADLRAHPLGQHRALEV